GSLRSVKFGQYLLTCGKRCSNKVRRISPLKNCNYRLKNWNMSGNPGFVSNGSRFHWMIKVQPHGSSSQNFIRWSLMRWVTCGVGH
ncbi:Hypothetical predicted protein, partial [Paramuricea clavata]